MKISPTLLVPAAVVSLSLLVSTPAHATLGEKADSVAKDRMALAAVKRPTTTGENYTVHEMATDGTTVREYINTAGIVFAVTWTGMAQPDLTSLLGSYAEDYRSAKAQLGRKHGQKRSQVKGQRVVVETGGHMRKLRGRAYDPTLLPEGVNLDEIR